MAAITTNEMIFRTLKTKVWNYKGERNPEPKYAEQLRAMGYTVEPVYEDEYDVDARWTVNGCYINSCEGKDLEFKTVSTYVCGMSNISKIDFVHFFEIREARNAKRDRMFAHDDITDDRYYSKDWYGRRVMRQSSYNLVVDRYKSMRHRIDRNCKWQREDVARAQEKLAKAQKDLAHAMAALERAEAENAETISKLDEFLKAHGVR